MLEYTKISKEKEWYFISNKKTGAVSKFSKEELLMFFLYDKEIDNGLINFLSELKVPKKLIEIQVKNFKDKLEKDGWFRNKRPDNRGELMESVYLNITTDCNFKCPYCYQGNEKTKNNMSINDAEFIIDKIKEINKNCVIIITGGEPFLHPGIFRILDYISKRELTFTVLTNGILISDDISQKLKEYKNLINIQISLDGFKKETHALTRGNTFDSVMRGIKNIIKHKLPFSLAPTIHNRNLDEIYDIAEFAFSNEGGFTPNNLRDFNKDDFDLYLSNENLTRIINDVEKRLKKKFSKDYLRLKRKGFKVLDCNRDHFICGMGYSLFDIDYNGDVYPCHLLKENVHKIGNIKTDSIDVINDNVKKMGIRCYSYEIEKCSECHFMSTCGGACRAGTYYGYNSYRMEDPICDVLYANEVQNMK